jgi:hypothetical protein
LPAAALRDAPHGHRATVFSSATEAIDLALAWPLGLGMGEGADTGGGGAGLRGPPMTATGVAGAVTDAGAGVAGGTWK